MPAIDPLRLKRELEQMVGCFSAPERCVEETETVLEFYADRVRRPGTLAATRRPARTLGVPRQVVAALAGALRQAAQADPASAWQIADLLWEAGSHEERQLAVSVVGAQADPRVAAWVSSRLERSLDDGLRRALADEALQAWRTADPEAFLALGEEWITRGDPQHQVLAWSALAAACERDPAALVRQVLDVLYRLPSVQSPSTAEARLQLLTTLTARQPSETAAYLAHEYQRGAPGSERPLRLLLDQFPAAIQDRLRQALRSTP